MRSVLLRTFYRIRRGLSLHQPVTPAGKPVVAGCLAMLLIVGPMIAPAPDLAAAYDINQTTTWPTGEPGGRTTSLTSASGITTTITMGADATSHNYVDSTNSAIGTTSGTASSLFTPQLPNGTPTMRFDAGGTSSGTPEVNCTAGQTCSTGYLDISFSEPVKDPILHVYGLGSARASTSASSDTRAATDLVFDPTRSSPGVTIGSVLPGATNLKSSDGTIGVINYSASVRCDTTTDGAYYPAQALSGCGSVQINGVVDTLRFDTNLVVHPQSSSYPASPDGYGLIFTFDQHYSDAPASYNGSQAPAAVIGDLALGSTVVANATSAATPASSPHASSESAVNSTAAGEDAVTSWPALGVANIGSPYSLDVPITGASQAGQVCGYIDFTRAGNFNADASQACTSFRRANLRHTQLDHPSRHPSR